MRKCERNKKDKEGFRKKLERKETRGGNKKDEMAKKGNGERGNKKDEIAEKVNGDGENKVEEMGKK